MKSLNKNSDRGPHRTSLVTEQVYQSWDWVAFNLIVGQGGHLEIPKQPGCFSSQTD